MVTCLSKWCSHLCFRAARALVGFSGVRVPCNNTPPLNVSVQWRTGRITGLEPMHVNLDTFVQKDPGMWKL